MITIDCVADLHGHYPKLEGGDLLIVAGDYEHPTENLAPFLEWFNEQNYKQKVFVAGNHDNESFHHGKETMLDQFPGYLCDSGIEFEGLNIWGSPWIRRFQGMNTKRMAFTLNAEEDLAKKWALIPDDVDILVTHCPPLNYLDSVYARSLGLTIFVNVGSKSLGERIHQIDDEGNGKRRLLVCGHIHQGYGRINISNLVHDKCTWIIVNASHVNDFYEPANPPIRIVL